MLRSRPCRICHRWFLPDLRAGDRQHVCSAPECQKQRQHDNVAAWRQLHPEYRVAHAMRLRERLAHKQQVVDPLEMPAPLSGLPWQVAQKYFGVQCTDFLAQFGRLLVREAEKLVSVQQLETTAEPGRLAGVTPEKAIAAPAGSGP